MCGIISRRNNVHTEYFPVTIDDEDDDEDDDDDDDDNYDDDDYDDDDEYRLGLD